MSGDNPVSYDSTTQANNVVTSMKISLPIIAALLTSPGLPGIALAAEVKMPLVRIAELEIDPARLVDYQIAVKEEMETSVRTEPGVLAIYAVAEKDHPTRLRFFEIYADEAAYRAHIQSTHFQKYFMTTTAMIMSRKLIETVPLQLSAK